MKKIISLLIVLITLSSCDFFKSLNTDMKTLEEIAKSSLLVFTEGENANETKHDILLTIQNEDSGVTFEWTTSDPTALLISGQNAQVARGNEDKVVFLSLKLKKGGATKQLSWKIYIPGSPFLIPTTEQLLTFASNETAEDFKTAFTYLEDLSGLGEDYEQTTVSYEVTPAGVIDLNGGTGSKMTDLQQNSSYLATLKITFTSVIYPDDTVNQNVPIQIKPVLPSGSNIQTEIAVEGKTLKLTYFDEFDNQGYFENDWDIGNPGYGFGTSADGDDYTAYRAASGNAGIETPSLVQYPDGTKGYSGDRYKQPYWSPKATKLNGGNLEIHAYWDSSIIANPTGHLPGGTNSTQGYGLAGAIHSKRQFPCGLFITKIKHSTGKKTCHWDAWWAESNNPFSRKYGEKTLFMPTGGEDRARRGHVFTSDNYSDVEATDRGRNGEQVYEFDMYEWVANGSTQWQVIHAWAWYGGYPGNEQRTSTGDIQLWSTNDNLRQHDRDGISGVFSSSYNDSSQASSGDWFYLVMLVTPNKIQMWNCPIRPTFEESLSNAIKTSVATIQPGAFGNNEVNNIWPANDYAPIQIKYSSEIGQWSNNHAAIKSSGLTPDNPDIMYSEFFAFYAWEEDRTLWYGGKTFSQPFID